MKELDRYPGLMETSELHDQARIISELLNMRLRETFANVLITYARDIDSVLYGREVSVREPAELSDDELEKCIDLVLSLSLFSPRRRVAVPAFDFLHALVHERKEREGATGSQQKRPSE